MEEEIKNYYFFSYFQHIYLCFYSNFEREGSLDAELNFESKEYPFGILFMGPSTPKTRNTWKHVIMTSSSRFFRYLLFWGDRGPSKICRVGTRWIWNLITHPTSSPTQNLSKNTGRYVENMNKKSSFFILPKKLITIILLF